jgi:hypothetical protein
VGNDEKTTNALVKIGGKIANALVILEVQIKKTA